MDGPEVIASPWDLLRHSASPMHPRFRRLEGIEPPAGLPNGFTLGQPMAPGNDWSAFAEEANARGLVDAGHRVRIAYEPATQQDADDFAASLDAQIFAGRISLVLHGPAVTRSPALAPRIELTREQGGLRDHSSEPADTIVYLAGRCVLDPLALERICRMTRVSRLIAMPIVDAGPDRTVSLPATVADWPADEPWRHVHGRNIAVSAALAKATGQPGAAFAVHCARHGAYVVPVFVPELVVADGERGGMPGTPRVTVIVVVDGAAWAAARSIDSLLAQHEAGLEVCLWAPNPLARLWLAGWKWRYGRLRLLSQAQLDAAIAASGGEFVGVLEAGDRLGQGVLGDALSRFVRPDLAAVRIREGSGTGPADAKPWTRPSSDRLLAAMDTSGFTIFRRSAWARVRPAERTTLFDALSGTGLVETTRSDKFERFRWRRRSAADRRVESELSRRDLQRYWQAGSSAGDRVERKADRRLAIFWPNYSRDNAYQRLLYGPARDAIEYVGGDIDVAIAAAAKLGGSRTIFHIHWTNPIFRVSEDASVVQAEAETFLARLAEYKRAGGLVVWTVHNIASHRSKHFGAEIAFAQALVTLADRVHVHAQRSLAEIEAHFLVPRDKLRIARHGNYLGVYADYIPRAIARRELGLRDDDDVLLFTGSLRSYKGPRELIEAFRRLLPANPRLRLILAGDARGNETPLLEGLSEAEAGRVLLVDRFLDDNELQLYLRAADAGVYPYGEVLTSGSVLLAMSFGLPVVAPRFGMISETVPDGSAGFLYDRADPDGLAVAIARMVEAKRAGLLESLRAAASSTAQRSVWQRFDEAVLG